MFCESLRPNPASGNNEEATAERNLTNLLRTIQSQNQQIMEKLNSTLASDNDIDKRSQGKRKEVPRRVERAVHQVVLELEEKSWDLGKPFTSHENKEIKTEILKRIRATDKGTQGYIIARAIKTYFYSRKRKEKNVKAGTQNVILKKQRQLQRRHEKVSRRKKALKASTTLPEQEKTRYMGALKAAYMSSDESMSDEDDSEDDDQLEEEGARNARRRKFLTRRLPWRSTQLEELIKSLDRKSSRRRSAKAAAMMAKRQQSSNESERLAPQDAPQWAIRTVPQ